MKKNVLIVLFSLLLAVHVNADCESDCSDAYNAALQQCGENYSKAMKQCSDTYDELYAFAEEMKVYDEIECKSTFTGAKISCDKTALAQELEAKALTQGFIDEYTAEAEQDIKDCQDDEDCIDKVMKKYTEQTDALLALLQSIMNRIGQDHQECRAKADEALRICINNVSIAFMEVLNQLNATLASCRAVAEVARDACYASAHNAYSICIAGCGG